MTEKNHFKLHGLSALTHELNCILLIHHKTSTTQDLENQKSVQQKIIMLYELLLFFSFA